MSGEDESQKHCESNLSHEDIKPCRVDIKQCSNMSGEDESRSHEDIKPCRVDIK